MNKFKRVIAFVSDLHIGGRYALCPPKYLTREGVGLKHSKEQKKIWNFWLTYCKECDNNNVDTVVIVGDTVHGQNPAERGIMLLTPDVDEQKEMAIECLKPLVRKRQLCMFPGSSYHSSILGSALERDICNVLYGEWEGAIANLVFEPSKKVFNISHGQSAAYIYREMLMGREALHIKWAESLRKIPNIDVIVRGHWHHFIYFHENRLHMIQLPGWMAYEPSRVYLKSYGKMQPDIGGVIVFIDHQDRIRVWHYLMDKIPNIADSTQRV
jgi:hypothetical protein